LNKNISPFAIVGTHSDFLVGGEDGSGIDEIYKFEEFDLFVEMLEGRMDVKF
jgi:hypothetical protein